MKMEKAKSTNKDLQNKKKSKNEKQQYLQKQETTIETTISPKVTKVTSSKNKIFIQK